METAKSKVLEELLSDIDSRTFELEAWKQKANLILKKIFGEKDEKIGLIENLHYEFSSWSLRDSSGGKSNDKVKETARNIIGAAISELSLLQSNNLVLNVLKEELTGKDFASLTGITNDASNQQQELSAFFSKMPATAKDEILAKLVSKSIEK